MAPPKTMKAIQIKAFDTPYSVSEIPVPRPKPYQLLVQVKASGFCHSDLMVMDPASNSPLPLVGSHEPAGVVVEVGDEAEGFAVGDRVGCLSFENVCGECPDCKAGKPIFCDKPGLKGFNTDGGWSEYMVSDARFTVKLPESLDFPTAACLMCAGVTVYAGIKKADVQPGGSIGIIGIGGLGHIGTQIAKAMGYKVVAVDVKQSSLDLLESHVLKPDVSILATDPVDEAVQRISEAIPGDYAGVDATILATDAPPAFRFAADMTRKHGTLVLLGQPEAGVTMTFRDLIFRDLRLVGSILADRETAQELVQLVAEHRITVKTTEWKVGDAEAMRQEYLSGRSEGKNVIVF